MRTERARFLSIGEESEVRMGADFIAGEISVLTTPIPHPLSQNESCLPYRGFFDNPLLWE